MEYNTILEAIDLCKVYGTGANSCTALKDLNLQIKQGEFIGIMGPSGSGKSTLLNLISTIDKPTSGKVLIDGKDVFSLNENQLSEFRRKKLGFIFQSYNLLNQMTAYENITLPMALAGASKKEQQIKSLKLAKLFEIESLLSKNPSELSGGEKQRVTAARAIIMDPAIVMADEPTGALDSRSSNNLMETLCRMNYKSGVTIVMVTHDAFAASFADRIIHIKDGSIATA